MIKNFNLRLMDVENFILSGNNLRFINVITRHMSHPKAATTAAASVNPNSTLSQTWMYMSFRFTCPEGMERMS